MTVDRKIDFCTTCGKNVPYTVLEEKEWMTVRGVRFWYMELVPRCDVCGDSMYVPEINDENCIRRAYAYYKAKEGPDR